VFDLELVQPVLLFTWLALTAAVLVRLSQGSTWAGTTEAWSSVLIPFSFALAILVLGFAQLALRYDAVYRVSQFAYRIEMGGRVPKGITIGGNFEKKTTPGDQTVDDVFINNLPGNFAELRPTGGSIEIAFSDGESKLPDPRALVRVNGRALNVASLEDAVVIVETAGGEEIRVRVSAGALLRAPRVVAYDASGNVRSDVEPEKLRRAYSEIPVLDWRICLVPSADVCIGRPLRGTERIFPLRVALEAMGLGAQVPELRSFIYFERSKRFLHFWEEPLLAVLDEAVRVEKDGEPTVAKASHQLKDLQRMSFLSVEQGRHGRYLKPTTALGGIEYGAGDTFEVAFLRPRQETVRSVASAEGEPIFLASFYPPPGVQAIRILGNSQVYEAASTYIAESKLSKDDRGFSSPPLIRLIQGDQEREVESGTRFPLGGQHAIETSVEVVSLRKHLQLLVWVLAAAAFQIVLVASGRNRCETVALLLVVNAFLLLRLLFGLKAWLFDPHREEAFALACYGLFLVPGLIGSTAALARAATPAESSKGDGDRLRIWSIVLVLVVAASASLQDVGAAIIAMLAVALPGAILLAYEAAVFVRRPSQGGLSMMSRYRRQAEDFGFFRVSVMMLVGLGLARVGLFMIGSRERLLIAGSRVSIEMLYTPLVAVAVALACGTIVYHFRLAWNGTTDSGIDRTRFVRITSAVRIIVVLGLIGFAVGVVGILVSDIGMILPGAIGLLGVVSSAGILLGLAYRKMRVRAPALQAVAVAAFLVPLALCALPWAGLALASSGDPDRGAAYDTNRLRLLAAFRPEVVQDIGTQDALSVLQTNARTAAYAGAYSSDRLEFHGYLGTPMPKSRPTDLTDNAAAVYLMADFGKFGATFVAFLLLALAAIPAFRARAPEAAWDPSPGFVTAACLWTMAGVGLYMLLGNLGAVPLTGKNVYLLGLDSGADLVGSAVLLVLAALGAELQGCLDES